jgi:hypothetical protein
VYLWQNSIYLQACGFTFFFKVTRIMGHEDFPTFWTTFLFFEAMKSADLPLGQAISS